MENEKIMDENILKAKREELKRKLKKEALIRKCKERNSRTYSDLEDLEKYITKNYNGYSAYID